MPVRPFELPLFTIQAKVAFPDGLRNGLWWQICQAIAWGKLDADAWLADLPEPEQLTDAEKLERWRKACPAGQFFDPPEDLTSKHHTVKTAAPGQAVKKEATDPFLHLRLLHTAALQLHVVRLAREVNKSGLARLTFATSLPDEQLQRLAALEQATMQLHERYRIRGIVDRPRGWSRDALKFWLISLLTDEVDVFTQRLNVLWVRPELTHAAPHGVARPIGQADVVPSVGEHPEGGVACLVLSLVPGAEGKLFADPAMAFLEARSDFIEGLHSGSQAARSMLADSGCPWPANTGLTWRIEWPHGETLSALAGPGFGGAAALGTYLLARRATWITSHSRDSLLLDPEITKGIAVSAAIRSDTGEFTRLYGLTHGLRVATHGSPWPPLHTLVIASDELLDEAEGFRVVHPGNTALLERSGTGQSFTLVRARDLATAVYALESHVHRLWGRALPFVEKIHRFLACFLGTPNCPVPFGGRVAALVALDAWFNDENAPNCLLLIATAGMGKSALLTQWVAQRLWLREDIALVFLPVSLRFGTSQSHDIADGLLARLLALHGKAQPCEEKADTRRVEEKLAEAAIYLRTPLPDGRRLLLVLDGLDEAADWRDLKALLPPPGENTRLLVAARPLAGDTPTNSWRERLEWRAQDTTQTIDLAALDRDGLIDVLLKMGAPLDTLADKDRVVDRLLALTEGDPLFTRFYVEDLWGRSEAVSQLTLEDLDYPDLKSGLTGYFERWWEDQVQNNPAIQANAVQEVLGVLACALGPLLLRDLRQLLPDTLKLTSAQFGRDVKPAIARWVIGDAKDHGYLISHPRLAVFFRDEKYMPMEIVAIERRFLGWGEQTIQALNDGAVAHNQVPAYLVQYYGMHLQRAYQEQREHPERRYFESIETGLEALKGLVTEGWIRVWERFEGGTYAGFLTDVDRVYAATTYADRAAVERGEKLSELGIRVRCVLFHASANSLASNLPHTLPARLVQAGVWQPNQALATARLIADSRERQVALDTLAHLLPEDQRRALLAEALQQSTRDIGNESQRAPALGPALAPPLPELSTHEVMVEALATARNVESPRDRAQALTSIADHFPEAERPAILAEALQAAWRIGDATRIASNLMKLAARLPEPQRDKLVAEIHAALCSAVPHQASDLVKEHPDKPLAVVAIEARFAELTRQQRADAVETLAGRLAPSLIHHGGPEALVEIVHAVLDVTRLWP